jgi:anti-sigma B factor antagonist
MGERLTVVTHTAGECVVLTLAGELDVTNAAEAEEAVRILWQDPPSYLVFDLSRLVFMDSTGVRVLVRARRRAREHEGTIVLAGLTPSVSRIIELTGLDKAFAIHATLGEAFLAGSEPVHQRDTSYPLNKSE